MMLRSILLSVLFSLFLLQRALPQTHKIELISHTTLDLVVNDLDGDGDLDLVAGGLYNLVWYENDGWAHFEKHTINLDAKEAQQVLVTDLDGDGHKDLVVADMGTNRIIYYHNNGDLTWDRLFLHSNTGGVSGLAVGDMDGDGDLDLACAAFTANKVYWLRNDGGFAFTQIDIATGMTGATRIVMNDLDDDGDLDVVAAMQTAGAIRLFRNNGSGAFTNELLLTTSTPRSLKLADVDQNGRMDLVYAGSGGAGYLRNNGTTFTQQQITGYSGLRGLGFADLTGDGYNDLIMADYTEDRITWSGLNPQTGLYQGMGSGTLDTWLNYASIVHGADFDGDGVNDVLAASSFDIRIYLHPGNAPDERLLVNRYLGDGRGIAHGDLDGDGDMDLMAVGGLYINWYENDGEGYMIPRIATEGIGRITIGGGVDLKLVDLDGDGDLDAVLTESSANRVTWLENNGNNGTFTKRLLTGHTAPYSCDVVDFDGDGDIDVVVTSIMGNDNVYWYENDGSQNFATQHPILVSYADPYEARAMDYDNDGDMDVVVACHSNLAQNGKVVLCRNNGNDTFTAQELDAAAPQVTSVFWVDLDQDGHMDVLATTGGNQNRVNWYRSNGAVIPSFTKTTIQTGMGYATYVVADDLDGDGDIDVVVSCLSDRNVNWLENDGAEQFTRHILARNVFNSQFVGAGDLDGDGIPEIYATDLESEAVHLYRKTTNVTEPVIGPEPVACHDPFISEMVHHPGDIARALEIYNPRSEPLDLTGYALRFYANGRTTYDATMLNGIIPPHGTHIVVAPNYATNINTYADQITNLWFDGSDAIVLVHNDRPIDIIGKVGQAFGDLSYWFNNGVGTYFTVLVRKPTVDRGDVNGTDDFLPDVEWIAYPVNDYSHLGSHEGPCGGVCTPTVEIATANAEVCAGETTTLTANVTGGGTAPVIQWTLNGDVAGSGASFTTPALSNDAVVACNVVSNEACAPSGAVVSTPVTITVVPASAPVASINGAVLAASPVPSSGYQWYFEGDPVPGATASTYTATQAGSYNVSSVVDGCESSLSNTVIFDFSTMVGDHARAAWSLFPNPTAGYITIRSNEPVDQVQVWNATGARVLVTRSMVLDLSGHAPGVYCVSITVHGTEHRRTVVLQ